MLVKSCALAVAFAVSGATPTPRNEVVVGNIRVQALSASLLRIEPKGPQGFEDRTTFTVVERDFGAGLPLSLVNSTTAGSSLLSTPVYDIWLHGATAPPPPPPSCAKPMLHTDVTKPTRATKFPNGYKAAKRDACCAACATDSTCIAWVHVPTALGGGSGGTAGANCWPLSSFSGLVAATKDSGGDRTFGCATAAGQCTSSIATRPNFVVTAHGDPSHILYNSSAADTLARTPNLLHFPSPASSDGYCLTDFPRFFVPTWATTPIPATATVDPALRATNGYDFRNNVNGDAYVFLPTTAGYTAARAAFVKLAGGCPLLPDFAYGTVRLMPARCCTYAAQRHWANKQLSL